MGSRMYDKETGRLAQYGLNQQVQIARENWTTPLADDTNIRKNKFAQGGTPLSMQASNWPTPKVNDMDQDPEKARERMRKREEQGLTTGGIRNLTSDAKNWPTPGANEDRADNYTVETSQRHLEEGRQVHLAQVVKMNWPTPTTQETPHEDMELTDTGRRKTKDGEDSHSLNLQDVTANWPTPNTRDTRRGCNQKQLATEVDKWQTPQSRDYKGPNTGFQEMLPNQVQQWPTPTVAEADKIGNRPNYGQQGLSNHPAIVGYPEREKMSKSRKSDGNSTNPDILSIHQDQETGTDGHTCSPSCRRLNPLFAEHLMGLPLGWTSVSGPLEMGLYRQWQHSLSENLRKSYR